MARYLNLLNRMRLKPQEGNSMNDRINYSGLVDLHVNLHDEPEPDLREWPTSIQASSQNPPASHRDPSRHSDSVSED
jgi:hypothetical protein